ncbi:MAG: TerC family protein [Actinomycetia bacterium]|nr:TerC family protein [Actinomycetes bacterium]
MDVPVWLWLATIAGLVAVIAVDLAIVDSRPHVFGAREAIRWVIFYVALAVAFGGFIYWAYGSQYAGEFFGGYITEYSLSIDNLFVFIVIMSSFAVPAIHQHRVLLVGVVIALILRGIMIALGAAAISAFAVTFYLFGALLIFTAIRLAKGGESTADPAQNPVVRLAKRIMPTTDQYHGRSLIVRREGRRYATPMLLVMLSIGTTDLLFALDSIPAIFGLTQEAYLVFTANAFALMGLRQLYFMVNGLLDKLVYLSIGLAVILAFIGIKLILEAVHQTTDLPVPTISIGVSLAVIAFVLLVTTVASLWAVRRNPALTGAAGKKLHEEELMRGSSELSDLADPADPEDDRP